MISSLLPIPVHIRNNSEIGSVDFDNLSFGKITTDHMYIAEYNNGDWQSQQIEPFHELLLSPFTLALHYGQTVFEGMKAFRMKDGNISVFRPDKHHQRFNISLKRMCMPEVSYEMFLNAITAFVQLENKWVPSLPETSLYIRPFMFASEHRIGATASGEYIFIIAASPSGPFYAKPLHLKVETEFVRAVKGGTGYSKCGGNYAAALLPNQLAKENGFDQVLWTDSFHHEFIEESGTMNIMFIINNTLITPSLDSGTILNGVTRDSVLTLAREMNMNVEERKIGLQELIEAFEQNKKVEMFGTGTAAVIAPVKSLTIGDKTFECYIGADAKMFEFKMQLTQIRIGELEDRFHWNHIISVE